MEKNQTKCITLYKTNDKKLRDSIIQFYIDELPNFEVYTNSNFRSDTSYEIKAKGEKEEIIKHQQLLKDRENKPVQIIIDLLKKELEPLRIIFIEKTKNWTIEDFKKSEPIAKMTHEELMKKYGFEKMMDDYMTGERVKKLILSRDHSIMIKNAKDTVEIGLEENIKRNKGKAELHYIASLEKLAHRINKKQLNLDSLRAKTTFSEIDVNISTTISDGANSVKAWTIIAYGPIQRPHYRYLVK